MNRFYRSIAALFAILFFTQHAIVSATAWDKKAIAQQEFEESKQPGSSWFQLKSPNSDDFLSRLKKGVLTPRNHSWPACQSKYAGERDSPMGDLQYWSPDDRASKKWKDHLTGTTHPCR
ncbi:hypothetical protein BDR26DRAFT_892094 [Obelidium mucronatum]|nr:hypothetical protein BDR26DRAFT_892094 [Obelidium mucronatum]